MKKKQVKILGISYSQSQTGSYVIVLAELKGRTKLPLIVKPNDAQLIASKIEGIKTQRPLTHDLIKSLTDSFNIDIQEVHIYSVLEGIFYAKIISSNGLDEVEIECCVGDALALSIVYGCPIYVSQSVLNIAGVIIDDDGTGLEVDDDDELVGSGKTTSTEDLEKMMEEAIANEEYEIAAGIRDRIQTLKNK
jgi:bifunctional DNase/RNase